MTSNQLTYWRDQESRRSNLSKENENRRSNRAVEAENQRSNLAREAENIRSNLAKEMENLRHNRATELVNIKSLSETEKHNRAMEEIDAVRNALTQSGLELQKAANYIKLNEVFAKYGVTGASELPDEAKVEMLKALGMSEEQAYKTYNELGADTVISAVFDNIWEFIVSMFGGAGKALF